MALQRFQARCVNRRTLRSPDVSEQPPVRAGRRVSQGLTGAIRPIAAAVICEADRILVWEDYDPSTGDVVAVPLAGGIEFGETGEQAIARELGEEIGAIPRRIRFLGLIEDIYEWAGKKRHELYLIYHVDLEDQDAFEGEELTVTESDGTSYVARWRPLSEFRDSARLVPEGLFELVECVRK
jgi:ADP-ribose pyrophosphatase YjhB (NUDIX family)